MGIHYSTNNINRPYFSWDAQNPKTYVDGTTVRNLLGKSTLPVTNVTVTDPPSSKTGKTYTFNNPNNTSTASDYIKLTPKDADEFRMDKSRGCSAFVTFKNTALMLEGTASHYRQCPFSYGQDSSLGQWCFERFYLNSSFIFRYKFDQNGTYGSTLNFGTVDLDTVNQLGFTQSSTTLAIYLNGVQVNSIDITASTLTSPTQKNVGIGAENGVVYGFIGEIYNATFWQTALSEEEVSDHYNNTYTRYV